MARLLRLGDSPCTICPVTMQFVENSGMMDHLFNCRFEIEESAFKRELPRSLRFFSQIVEHSGKCFYCCQL